MKNIFVLSSLLMRVKNQLTKNTAIQESKKRYTIFATMEGFNMNRLILAAILLLTCQGFAGEFLVKYKNSSAFTVLNQMSTEKSAGLTIMSHHEPGQWFKVDINKSKEVKTIIDLLANPSIEYVVPNFKLYSFSTVPNVIDRTTLKEQWAIAKVQAEKAWTRAGNRGSKNVLLAVIDTGADYKHKALASNMVPGFNFKDNNADPMDITGAKNPGHGTHCSGIIAANGTVEGGTIGISPELSVMPLRFLGADGSGTLEDGIKAIDYAIEKGAHVISASWGAAVPRSQALPLIEAVKRADDKGVIFVAAAANDGKNNDVTEVFPTNAGTPNMIAVAASDDKDQKPSWSNYGKATVHVAAPGLNIMSTLPADKYGNLSGTSMATPLVAGLTAFLKAQDMTLTGAQIRALLQTSGAKVNIETACNCRVDALSAVDTVLAKKMWLVPAAATIGEKETVLMTVMNGQSPFKFASSNPAAVTVAADGTVTAVAKGTATITVTDAAGKTASTLDMNVGKSTSSTPETPGECPGEPQECEMMCTIMPELPWCPAGA